MAISFTSRCPFSVYTGTATTRRSSPVFRISLAKPISHPFHPSLSSSIPKQRCSHKSFTIMMGYEAGIGVMGTKLGMMTYFETEGTVVPVTVIGFGEGNIVTQVKTEATDDYSAVQVGYRRVRDKKLTKPEMGHLNKAGAIPMRHLQEFRLLSVEGLSPIRDLPVMKYSMKVILLIKGHRALGSIGAGTTPGHVYKGKKMPGRMGGTKTKIRKLKIMKIDNELRILMVKGAVPRKPGGTFCELRRRRLWGRTCPRISSSNVLCYLFCVFFYCSTTSPSCSTTSPSCSTSPSSSASPSSSSSPPRRSIEAALGQKSPAFVHCWERRRCRPWRRGEAYCTAAPAVCCRLRQWEN